MEEHNDRLTTGHPRFTVGFHNFNLRIFNLRISNPNKLIVYVFVDTMSDFNVPGSRPPKKTIKFRKSTVSTVYLRDDGRSSFLAAVQWTDAQLSLQNLFHAKYIPGFLPLFHPQSKPAHSEELHPSRTKL